MKRFKAMWALLFAFTLLFGCASESTKKEPYLSVSYQIIELINSSKLNQYQMTNPCLRCLKKAGLYQYYEIDNPWGIDRWEILWIDHKMENAWIGDHVFLAIYRDNDNWQNFVLKLIPTPGYGLLSERTASAIKECVNDVQPGITVNSHSEIGLEFRYYADAYKNRKVLNQSFQLTPDGAR